MKLQLRKLKSGEVDSELFLGLIFVPLLLAVAVAVVFMPERMIPSCVLYHATGLSCPACGAYRCFSFLVSGDPAEAFRTQPLAALTVMGLVLYSGYSVVVTSLDLPRLRFCEMSRRDWMALAILFVACVGANWVYLLISM
ncbi:MAG: DUF2752 domain-containing protein [Verrucomicrobiota bacterium]